MARSVVAKRYAAALARIAAEDGSWQAWREDLDRVAAALANRPLQLILESPRVPRARKLALVQQVLGRALRAVAISLLTVLVRRGHVDLFGDIREWFAHMADAAQGIERYEVMTAVPLDDAERRLLRERLGEREGKTIILAERVDPEILGGMVIRREDLIQDYSVRGRLEALREILEQAPVGV